MIKKKLSAGRIFIISGPSGSGKTTLVEDLLGDRKLSAKLARSISFTTRPKRSGEKDRKDYFFIGIKQFREKRKAKKILEWTKYLGYYYATPRDYLEKQLGSGRSLVLCLDLKGAAKLKRQYPGNVVRIFVLPPSLRILTQRIKSRCHKTGRDEIRRRLNLARQELSAARKYDYCVINRNLGAAAKELKRIILQETLFQ